MRRHGTPAPAPRRRAYGGEPFPAVSWLDALWRAGAERLRDWVLAEAGSGRLVPWLPVAFGGGIVLYFTAQHEPELWAGGALTLAGVVAVFLLRRQPKALAAAALLAAAAAGFSVATFRAQNAAHPVLARPLFGVALAGWIEQREERERSDRITIAVRTIEIPARPAGAQTRAGGGPQGHRAAGRRLRRPQGAAFAAARPDASGRL